MRFVDILTDRLAFHGFFEYWYLSPGSDCCNILQIYIFYLPILAAFCLTGKAMCRNVKKATILQGSNQ